MLLWQAEREKAQQRLVELGHAHYAQSTHSSRMKKTDADDIVIGHDVMARGGDSSRDVSPSHSARCIVYIFYQSNLYEYTITHPFMLRLQSKVNSV